MPRPTVDILIPFHECYELVTRCVGSINHCTPNQSYRIILVDDASANTAYLDKMTHSNRKIIGVRLEEQSGFGAALATGFAKVEAQYIVIMHSDVYIDNIYWLANLQRTLGKLKGSGIKLVSSRSDNPGTASSYDPRLFGQPNDEVGDIVVESTLPLFCCLCNHELFKRIGGFIKPYPFAWYEDEELFWRMKYYGYKQAIAGASWVRHAGGTTIQKLTPKARQIMEGNRERCLVDICPYLPRKLERQTTKASVQMHSQSDNIVLPAG